MDSDLIKSMRSHKYIKREGAPGNYTYFYKMPDGSIRAEADMQDHGKIDHAKRLLAGHGTHHNMSTQDIAAHTGLDHAKVTSAKRNLARAGTTWQGRTFAGHGYNEHHMKEAKHADTSTSEYHAHAAASHGETHHVTEPEEAPPSSTAGSQPWEHPAAGEAARARRPRAPRPPRARPAPAAEEHDDTPATPEAVERMHAASREEHDSGGSIFTNAESDKLEAAGYHKADDDGSGLEAYEKIGASGHKYSIIRDDDGETRLNIATGSGTTVYSGNHRNIAEALGKADLHNVSAKIRQSAAAPSRPAPTDDRPPSAMEELRSRVASGRTSAGAKLGPRPSEPAAQAAPVENANAARIAKLRAKLANDHGLNLGGGETPTASTAERASKAAAIARASSPSAPAAQAVHAVAPDLAEADRPIHRMEQAQAAGENPYIKRASEIFHNIVGALKPERAATAKYMFQALDHLNNTSQPLNDANIIREYKRLSGKNVRSINGISEEFEKATFMTLGEITGNEPVNAEVERMKRGYGAKQFARMKPFIKQSWHDANPSAPPPYPTFGDVKSWGEHGGPKPEWAGSTRLAMPQEVFDAAHKGADGKPKYPPAWMPIHMMPAWNYVMKKSAGDDEAPYQTRNVNFQGGKLALGPQAAHQEGMVISALRKYVQMRGGPGELVDIPGAKLNEAGLSHADIFKGFDPHDLSDKTLKKLLKHKIVDPIALAPFLDKEMKGGTEVKKSFTLVISGDLPKVSFKGEDVQKSELIQKIRALRAQKSSRGLA